MARNLRFTRILARTQSVARDLGSLNFARYHPESSTWAPAVNVYRYHDRFEICVDLSGVEKERILLEAEPHRLCISGVRPSPISPTAKEGLAETQILALEIENGAFEREIRFAREIDTTQVRARQENGLLWITLPHPTTNHF